MMASAAQPVRAAELPLGGGREQATLTLHPLLCAEMVGPPGWFERVPGPAGALKALGVGVPKSEWIAVPIVAFLLEHPQAGPVLVDTGFHRSVAVGPASERSRNLGPVGRLMARGARMRPEQTAAAQLKEHGIDPSEVPLIVMTHLHFDHASALCDFPAATVLVSERELRAARGRAPFTHGYSKPQFEAHGGFRTLDFAAPGTSDHGPFERAIDVFGDGSLTLVFTPGHSLGHMSLIARLKDRVALLAGDAAYTMGTVREGRRPWRAEDRDAFERSLEAITRFDRENPQALVVPGHDIEAWQQLESVYR
jgi:N-acyl homoserine lactone hydrolase